MRRVWFVGIALSMSVGSLAAQARGIEQGTFEVGGFARYNGFPSVYKVVDAKHDRWGFGGRLGLFVARNWAIELDGSATKTDLKPNQPDIPSTINAISRPLRVAAFHLQLVYNAPLSNRFLWMIGAGGNYFKLSRGIQRSDAGFGAMTGLRWRALHALSFRLEGTADILPKGFLNKSNTYLGGQLGASFTLGGNGCKRTVDAVDISPKTANLRPGDTQAFSATATYCGAPDRVVYRLSGVGTVDSMTGLYRATTVGTAQVTAYSIKGKMTSAASITVETPPPPPPPPPPPAPPPPPEPPAPPPAAARYAFEMQMVHFRFDHADLTKGGQDSVKAIAATLTAHTEVMVDIIGHCDWIGTEAYNMKLSRARAETVRRLLIASGVSADRITVKWRGKAEPIADNKTAAGRAMNRRAEVRQNN